MNRRIEYPISLIASVSLGFIFIYAGTTKLLSPDIFLKDIESYHLFYYHANYLLAYFIPALEVSVGVGIMIPFIRRESAVVISALNIVFIMALTLAWVRGLDITCGCFGKTEIAANYPLLIGRDILFLAISVFVFYQSFKRKNCYEKPNL